MRKNSSKNKSVFDNLSNILEIPQGILSRDSQIILTSNKEVIVDSCKGILEYSDNLIRFNCGNLVVKIRGENLELSSLTPEQGIVRGWIFAVEFEV